MSTKTRVTHFTLRHSKQTRVLDLVNSSLFPSFPPSSTFINVFCDKCSNFSFLLLIIFFCFAEYSKIQIYDVMFLCNTDMYIQHQTKPNLPSSMLNHIQHKSRPNFSLDNVYVFVFNIMSSYIHFA